MSHKRCCVPGCTVHVSEGILHYFPNPIRDAERFQTWKARVGAHLVGLDDQCIFSNRRVCQRHFENFYHGSKNRLIKNAVPTLFLPVDLQQSCTIPPAVPVPIDVDQPTHGSTNEASQSSIPHSVPVPLDVDQPAHAGANEERNQERLKSDCVGCPIDVTIPSTSVSHVNIIDGNRAEKRSVDSDLTKNEESKRRRRSNLQQPTEPTTTGHKTANIGRPKCMTAREITLMKALCKLKALMRKKENARMSFKKRLAVAEKFSLSKAFTVLSEKMTKAAKLFFEMQISQSQKKGKGRRFTLDQKVLALSLYKPSPKAYRQLSQLCTLPKRKTLQRLLSRVELKPGIQENLFRQLRKRVIKMPTSHKYCTLVFDEMAIAPSVNFDRKQDLINGLCDDGEERKTDFCDHVLVLMVRGVIKKYKQPIAYTFCQSTTSTADLAKLIKSSIEKLQEVGLTVVATVCDQGATNVAAINSLIRQTNELYVRRGEEYRGGFFEIEGAKIFPIYDPPHLMKGIRNNLLTKDLHYKMNGQEKVAKWSDIVRLHRRPPGYKGLRMVPKLSAQHVEPALIPKMKVKHCTQVFSKSVGVAIGFMAKKGLFPKRSKETADIVLFFDDLFDSVNGSFNEAKNGKFLRTAVTPKSPHHKLWRTSLPVLKSMRYISKNNCKVSVPTLSSWIKTIEGFQLIIEYFNKRGLRSILLRHFNQDPLENFFGAIRSHGFSNIMPNASAFESAYKTLLLNNMTSAHSVGANCESDGDEAFKKIKYFFDSISASSEESIIHEEDLMIDAVDIETLLTSPAPQDVEKCAAAAYCSGWMIKKAKKAVCKTCYICKAALESEKEETFHSLIKFSEYSPDKTWLAYPSRKFFEVFVQIENVVQRILEKRCNLKGIHAYLELLITVTQDFKFVNCKEHKKALCNFIIKQSSRFFINNWCREVNKILTKKSPICDSETDIIKKAANKYVQKKKGTRIRQTGLQVSV